MQDHDNENGFNEEDFDWDSVDEKIEYRSPLLRRALLSIVALLILVSFIIWSFPQLGILFSDLSFLAQNKHLQEEEIVQASKPAIVSIEVTGDKGFAGKKGTGFNIAPAGVILTNHHVVQDASSIKITFSDGRSFYKDHYTQISDADIAVIQLDEQELPCLQLESHLEASDQTLTIIGDPLGYRQIAVQGSIGGFYKYNDYTIFEINAPIKKGNSGSPVLNPEGKVLGIIFAHRDLTTDEQIEYRALAIPLQQFSAEIAEFLSESQPAP